MHGNTGYTVGQVAMNLGGENFTNKTEDILGQVDRLLADAATDKS
ncbi:MAG: enamine deaminase RidA (YjgF/YER057c/UK114 family) [Candidatus Azotimanducaceae bacterium]|jgi:enamine deaminase RidA (YjgF/YER057c/UK114 family)